MRPLSRLVIISVGVMTCTSPPHPDRASLSTAVRRACDATSNNSSGSILGRYNDSQVPYKFSPRKKKVFGMNHKERIRKTSGGEREREGGGKREKGDVTISSTVAAARRRDPSVSLSGEMPLIFPSYLQYLQQQSRQ